MQPVALLQPSASRVCTHVFSFRIPFAVSDHLLLHNAYFWQASPCCLQTVPFFQTKIMSALQDLLSRALETESHEVDMEADAELKQRGHGQHDVFITSPIRLPQPLTTMLIIDGCDAASTVNIASALPLGVLLYPSLSPSTASFSSASSGCTIHPQSRILAAGEVIIVTVGSVPLPHCTHAMTAKLLQQCNPPSVVVLRCDNELSHPARLCSSSWTPQHAAQLSELQPMTFPHVLEGLSAAVATHCEADGVPCCVVSCPAAALAALASSIAGVDVSFEHLGQSSCSVAPPLYI